VNRDIAVIGAGYVGLPLAQTFAEAGQKVVLVDVVPSLVETLNRGDSHIDDVPSEKLRPLVESGAIMPVVDRVLPMSDAAEAHRAVAASDHVGKVLLVTGR
jgi:UDP-N-acetyl-D-mannosaminuronate dehydrogenase